MLNLPAGVRQSGKNSVGLAPIASLLIFVTKVGGDTHKLKLSKVTDNGNIFKHPTQVVLSFHNDGNTHLTPRGVVNLYDPANMLVSKGVINENSGLLLPELDRRYVVNLKSVASSQRLGNYRLTVAFRFDGLEQYRLYQTSRLFITPLSVLLIIFLLVAIWYVAFRRFGLANKLKNKLKMQKKN
jgi:hypothetical protein